MKIFSRFNAAVKAFGYTLTNGWQGSWPTVSVINGPNGQTAGPDTPMGIAAYFACLRVVSEDIAKLPVRVYQREGDSRTYMPDSPVRMALTRMPNPEMTPQSFKEVLTSWAMSWGNGFAQIIRTGDGGFQLWPIHPSLVQVEREEVNGQDIIYYVVNTQKGRRVYFTDEMFHLRGFGDGYVGYPVMSLASQTLGLSRAASNYARTFFESGGRPSGVLSVPEELSAEARQKLRDGLQQVHGGSQNTNKIAILDQGVTFTALSVPPETSQMLETRRFQAEEICRWFRVPPFKIMDLTRANYNAMEQVAIEYANDSLAPWVRRWEQEAEAKLVPTAQRGRVLVAFDLKGMMMGTHKDRAEYLSKMVQIGGHTPNEVRVVNDLEPIPGGDQLYMQVNLAPMGMSPAEMQEKKMQQDAQAAQRQPVAPPPPEEDNEE